MDGYLTKPVPLATLGETLKAWMPHGPAPTARAVVSSQPPADAGRPVDAAAPLDVSVLRGLVGDDPEVLREFLGEYRVTVQREVDDLRAAWARRDHEAIARVAHKVKSASRSVGARPLAECCVGLEQASRSGDDARVDRGVAEFERLLGAVLAALDAQPG